MLLRRGVPLEAKPFQLGVRIEQPQEQVNVARYGAHRRPPRARRRRLHPGRPRRRPRPVHLLHVRRRLRHAERQRARLLLHQRHEREPARLAVRQQRPGRDDRARATPAAATRWPASTTSSGPSGWPTWPAAAPTPRRSSGPATSWPAGRAAGRSRPATPRGTMPIDLGAILPPVVARGPGARPARSWTAGSAASSSATRR